MSNRLPERISRAIDAEWQRLGSPGTWWNAAERIEIARQTRLARATAPPSESGLLSETATEATRTIATNAHSITEDWIESCHDKGLGALPLVEMTAVVAKLVAIDTTIMGVGGKQLALPDPAPGEPCREEVEGAWINRGWLPTKGVASAPSCFSAVQIEYDAWDDLHSQLYLSLEEMRDNSIVKDLHRAQIELLAARTSNYNDCFY